MKRKDAPPSGRSRPRCARRARSRCPGRSSARGRPRRPRPRARDRTSRRRARRLARSTPGPRSATSTSTSPSSARAAMSIGLPAGVYLIAFSMQVDEHLLDEDRVERHERADRRRDAGPTSPPPQPVVQPIERGADDLLDRLQLLLTLSAPASRRVMSSRLRTRRLRRSASSCAVMMSVRRLRLVGGGVVAEERARRARHDGEGRPEVVRHGAEERVAELLRLGAQVRAARLFRELPSLERRADEARERLEQLSLLGIAHLPCRRGQQPEDPDAPARAVERHEERARRRQECRSPRPSVAGDASPLATPRSWSLGPRMNSGVGEDGLELVAAPGKKTATARRTLRAGDARRTRGARRATAARPSSRLMA